MTAMPSRSPFVRELLGPREVAYQLGVSRSKFYEWDRAGLIPSPVTIGGMRMWRRAELAQWIDAGCPLPLGWKYRPGVLVSVGELHALRLRQLADMEREVAELGARIAAGEKKVKVTAR